MKSPTDKTGFKRSGKFLLMVLLLFHSAHLSAQAVVSNPGEYIALAEGNELINNKVQSQIDGQTKTAALQNSMSALFTKIHEWQRKHNDYLRNVHGFASQLKASTQLYHDGVKCFINLCNVKGAISDNPQGALATLSMNNLWLEATTELLTIYNLLEDAVAKGGNYNMLTGTERATLLWALEEKLSAFNHKLKLLQRSIRIYSMVDVWNNATAGMIDRDYATIANQAHDRWTRVAKAIHEEVSE